MVLPGALAATLFPPSLVLLVCHLSSSQDVTPDPSREQQLCALREHPIVAFAGERPFPPSSFCSDHVLKDAGPPRIQRCVRMAAMGGMGLSLVSRQCVQALLSYLPGRRGLPLAFFAGERGVGPLGGLPRAGPAQLWLSWKHELCVLAFLGGRGE